MALGKTLAVMLASMVAMVPQKARKRLRLDGMVMDEDGIINLGGVLSIAIVILVAVVGMLLLAALAPTYLDAGASLAGTFSNNSTTTGNDDADELLPIFSLLIAFAVLFAIVGLVFAVVKLRGR